MVSATIIYKTKTAGEQDILTHLLNCKDNFIPSLDETVDIPNYAKKIAGNAITFEAWHDDELAGLVAAYLNDRENKKGFITNVSVVAGYGGRGIGARLMEDCIAFASADGFNELVLEVNRNNAQAIRLYNRYRFKHTAFKGNLAIMTLHLQDSIK